MTITLILGGARSGKSSRAQNLAEATSSKRVYIATAQALDTEMEARISRHQSERDKGWSTVEAPLDLAEALSSVDNKNSVILIDCLTLWLSNLMHHERDIETETATLMTRLQGCHGTVILVSNEVGMGLVPMTALGRDFRDAQGWLNQKIATICDHVEFVVAGLPLVIKGETR